MDADSRTTKRVNMVIIINIVGILLTWILIGLLITVFTSRPSKGHYNKDGEYDEDYYRVIFSIVLWPFALIIRIIKFIIYLLFILWIGFKKELKYK